MHRRDLGGRELKREKVADADFVIVLTAIAKLSSVSARSPTAPLAFRSAASIASASIPVDGGRSQNADADKIAVHALAGGSAANSAPDGAAKGLSFETKLLCFALKLLSFESKLLCFAAKLLSFNPRLLSFHSKLLCFGAKLLSFAPELLCFATEGVSFATKPLSFAT